CGCFLIAYATSDITKPQRNLFLEPRHQPCADWRDDRVEWGEIPCADLDVDLVRGGIEQPLRDAVVRRGAALGSQPRRDAGTDAGIPMGWCRITHLEFLQGKYPAFCEGRLHISRLLHDS